MNAERLYHLSNRVLTMLEGGPHDDARMGQEACTLLEEIAAINWSDEKNGSAVHVNAQIGGFAQRAMDGFERWFGPQKLAAEGPDEDYGRPNVEREIRSAIGSLRGIALEHLPR